MVCTRIDSSTRVPSAGCDLSPRESEPTLPLRPVAPAQSTFDSFRPGTFITLGLHVAGFTPYVGLSADLPHGVKLGLVGGTNFLYTMFRTSLGYRFLDKKIKTESHRIYLGVQLGIASFSNRTQHLLGEKVLSSILTEPNLDLCWEIKNRVRFCTELGPGIKTPGTKENQKVEFYLSATTNVAVRLF